MKLPLAKKIPHSINIHGKTRTDNYHWLRDDNWQKFIEGDLTFSNNDVKQYIDHENSYTETIMADTKELQKELYDEMLSRVNEDDSQAPMKHGEYFYYSRTEKGKDYSYLCRKKGSADAKEEIYFDQNLAAEGLGYYRHGARSFTKGDKYMAYAENTTGSMAYQVKVRDLEMGEDLPWEAKECNGGVSWCNDNEHLYYVERHPVNGRGYKIFRFNIHKGPKSKELVFEKPAELEHLFMGISKSNDSEFLFISLEDTNANQIYILDATDPKSTPVAFNQIEKDVLINVDSAHGKFYILTNEQKCVNNKLMTTSHDSFAREYWEEYIPHKDDVHFVDFDLYPNHLVMILNDNKAALPRLCVKNITTGMENQISMKDAAYDLDYIGAMEFESSTIQFEYESPIRPTETQQYDLESGNITLIKEGFRPNFDASLYQVERVFAPSYDGEQIPLTIVTKKDFIKDGSSPAFIYAYGSYGYPMPAYFSSAMMSLVDRGFSYSIAHIRGGSDKGHQWYLDGKLGKKINTFKDFISCTEYLIDQNYSTTGNITANGGSAGGLLMGAITNMRPDLYKSVILDVPFVDVVTTICDETLPLTPPEWNEWGNPITDEKAYNYMMSYSPYDNIEAKDYPNMLFNSGITDEQVTYWEPTKMVAKLRELKTDNNILMLKMKMTAGHAGSSARYQALKEKAFDFAFILKFA